MYTYIYTHVYVYIYIYIYICIYINIYLYIYRPCGVPHKSSPALPGEERSRRVASYLFEGRISKYWKKKKNTICAKLAQQRHTAPHRVVARKVAARHFRM